MFRKSIIFMSYYVHISESFKIKLKKLNKNKWLFWILQVKKCVRWFHSNKLIVHMYYIIFVNIFEQILIWIGFWDLNIHHHHQASSWFFFRFFRWGVSENDPLFEWYLSLNLNITWFLKQGFLVPRIVTCPMSAPNPNY